MLEIDHIINAFDARELDIQFFDNQENCKVIIEGNEYTFTKDNNTDSYLCENKYFLKACVYDALCLYTGKTLNWGNHTGVHPVAMANKYLKDYSDLPLDEIKSKFISCFKMSKEKCDLCFNIAKLQEPLLCKDKDALNIYISIPFCTSRCTYCTFSVVGIEKKKHLHKSYVDCLIKEIDSMKDLSYKIRSIYVGGGTPSAISADLLKRVLDKINEVFPSRKEFTVEAGRADTIDEEKLKLFKESDVTRICINPQTMQDDTLNKIKRNHSANDFVKAYNLAKSMGFENINVDLIAGLPGEELAHFKDTVDKIKDLDPGSVTVHTLALKRASVLTKQESKNLYSEKINAMLDYAYKSFDYMEAYYLYRQKNMEDNGENVGFCKEGLECLYNIDTMEENVSVLALGSAGVSKRVYEDKIERVSDPKDIEVYIDRIALTIRRNIEFIKK